MYQVKLLQSQPIGLHGKLCRRLYSSVGRESPIVQIKDGTFYRHHPSFAGSGKAAIPNPALFENLTFRLKSSTTEPEHWCIVGPSSSGKSTFLQILRGQHLCFPPTARSYPHLSSAEIEQKDHQLRNPRTAIQYVGFGGEGNSIGGEGTRGAYLSARYESRREVEDWSVLNFLQGRTQLNPDKALEEHVDEASLERVIRDLRLGDLVNMPVSNLSNGQTRRAKIARALLGKPEVLLLDEPFMGLDPPTLTTLSPLLHGLSRSCSPRLVMTLRPQDPIPDWITHIQFLGPGCKVAYSGPRDEFMSLIKQGRATSLLRSVDEVGKTLTSKGIIESPKSNNKSSPSRSEVVVSPQSKVGEAVVQMAGVKVSYGSKTVLGNWKQDVEGEVKDGLWWNVRKGERWGVFGPNGSGKTTILSLICSDHPQTYSLPILLFGRSRLPERGQPGISIFDLQAKIGHSSPEIHHFVPRGLNLRQVLESAWADTFMSKPKLDDYARAAVKAALSWFEPELRSQGGGNTTQKHTKDVKWADDLIFGGQPYSTQRLLLFLRAIIKKPELVILDEAFSGMDDEVRNKCMDFIEHGEQRTSSHQGARNGDAVITGLEEHQALICISHVREEIPGCVREWICLPEANTGKPARFGKLDGPMEGDFRRWNEIWGM